MGYFERASAGKKATALLTGMGIGAALMYVLDPERGRRRRALVRDKAVSLANQTGRAVAKTSRDLSNRAKGVAAEIRSASGIGRERGENGDEIADTGNGRGREEQKLPRPSAPGARQPERPGEL